MPVLRTPDAAFANLPDYPFAPYWTTLDGGDLGPIRVHHLDEGPADGPVVLLMHGEPSWSYLYRTMIPPLVAAGARCIAPDLVGFGKSDKPAAIADYTYARHVAWMDAWLTGLGVHDVTLFCQDWGGLIGLRLVAAHPGMFARVMVSNSFLPDGSGKASEAFLNWRKFAAQVPEFPTGGIIQGGTARGISAETRAAYDAPYPDESYKAGARAFPALVPVEADNAEVPANRAAWAVLETFDKPVLTAFGDSDPVTAGADRVLQARIPGTRGQPHTTVERAGHFCQEDAGPELSALLAKFMGLSPTSP